MKFTDKLQNLERLRWGGYGSPCGPVSTRCFEYVSLPTISFPHAWISLSKRSPFARDPYTHPFRIQHRPVPSRGSHSIKPKLRLKDASRVVEVSNIVTRRHAGRAYRAHTDFWESILTCRFGLLLPGTGVIRPWRYNRRRDGWSRNSYRWWAVESTSQDYVSGPANCFVDMGLRREQGRGCVGDGLEKESAVSIDQTCLLRNEEDRNDSETQSHISRASWYINLECWLDLPWKRISHDLHQENVASRRFFVSKNLKDQYRPAVIESELWVKRPSRASRQSEVIFF